MSSSITKILGAVKSSMTKPSMSHPTLLKGNVLLHTHVLRQSTSLLDSSQMEALNIMLKNSTSLLDAIVSICKNQDFYHATLECIDFQQYLTQALWVKDSPFLQLPHINKDDVDDLVSSNSKSDTEKLTFKEFLEIPKSEVKLPSKLSDAKKEDIMTALDIIPSIKISSKVFVDDDEDDNVYEGDLLTIQVTIERTDKAKLVYAPNFPYPKQEGWWVLLGNSVDNRILHVEKVASSDKVVQHKIKMQAPKQGTYKFNLQVKSNAYLGLDYVDQIEVKTKDSSALPAYKVHPDDAELDDEPTLFEEMMAANVEKDDSDDEDDSDSDDESEEGIRELSAAEMKRRQQQQEEDDSDDDSSVEEVHAD